jgi:hypothetical protein
MQKVLKFAKEFGIPIVSLLLPLGSFAAGIPPPPSNVKAPSNVLTSVNDINTSLCSVVNWVFYGLIVFAVIMVLIAAYGYLTSGGDPEKTKTAGQRLLYAAIAILVGIIAQAFPNLVGSFVGNGSLLPPCT